MAAPKAAARKTAPPKIRAPRSATPRPIGVKAVASGTSARVSPGIDASARRRAGRGGTTRKPPALDRARRVVLGDDIVSSPPSSLDLNRTASAARSGRRELRERFAAHTETGPTLTGGDIDADWESAYSVGDEAPGGDNPTPDQGLVDDIGAAIGVQYEDDEELKGEEKILERDAHRWELDPGSSDDFEDR
jgi:hypothetical protein